MLFLQINKLITNAVTREDFLDLNNTISKITAFFLITILILGILLFFTMIITRKKNIELNKLINEVKYLTQDVENLKIENKLLKMKIETK